MDTLRRPTAPAFAGFVANHFRGEYTIGVAAGTLGSDDLLYRTSSNLGTQSM